MGIFKSSRNAMDLVAVKPSAGGAMCQLPCQREKDTTGAPCKLLREYLTHSEKRK
jgi:hypothetical protein